ncbi:MAG: hypothetical protein HOA57_02195 [Candidatus Magasanikbacteria bacterium]|nr:hypothetical protein [Candidatus Magasanikbacteria bacterium]
MRKPTRLWVTIAWRFIMRVSPLGGENTRFIFQMTFCPPLVLVLIMVLGSISSCHEAQAANPAIDKCWNEMMEEKRIKRVLEDAPVVQQTAIDFVQAFDDLSDQKTELEGQIELLHIQISQLEEDKLLAELDELMADSHIDSEICNNDQDDDGDGWIDCHDWNCDRDPACSTTGISF